LTLFGKRESKKPTWWQPAGWRYCGQPYFPDRMRAGATKPFSEHVENTMKQILLMVTTSQVPVRVPGTMFACPATIHNNVLRCVSGSISDGTIFCGFRAASSADHGRSAQSKGRNSKAQGLDTSG
jgi:hypothetical protein